MAASAYRASRLVRGAVGTQEPPMAAAASHAPRLVRAAVGDRGALLPDRDGGTIVTIAAGVTSA